MYTPSHFEENRIEVLHEFVHAHPFGLLVTHGGSAGLEANAIPFLLDRGAGPKGTLLAHVARGNPVWRNVASGSEVLMAENSSLENVSKRPTTARPSPFSMK